MKKYPNLFILTLFILILLSNFVYAQKPPIALGKINKEDLGMIAYGKDSTAAAVVLADYGETSFRYIENQGFQMDFKRITRIKIFNTEGLKLGDVEIPVYHDGSDKERVSQVKGFTYNLEGSKIVKSKLKNDSRFSEKSSKHWDIEKFTMPNVKVGSVIEYSYTINSDFWFNLREWNFQNTIPIIWSEYRVAIPEYFQYQKLSQGYYPFSVNEQSEGFKHLTFTTTERKGDYNVKSEMTTSKLDYREDKFRWVAQDVPAFISEPKITTSKNYISKIEFELKSTKYPNQPLKTYLDTWPSFNKKFLELESFGLQLKKTGFLKDELELMVSTSPDQKSLISTIFNFVRAKMIWDGNKRYSVDFNLKRPFDNGKGSSAEINLLLTGLFRRAGLDADPVMLSTRDHGMVRENFPISNKFNYVVCRLKLEEGSILLDATDRFVPIGTLPERCLNGKGRVISNNSPGWIELKPAKGSQQVKQLTLSFTEDDNLKGKYIISSNGYASHSSRKALIISGEEEYLKKVSDQNQDWSIESHTYSNPKDFSTSMKEEYEIELNDAMNTAGNLIFINPMLGEGLSENPFKIEERKYPVDFAYANKETFMLTLTLPEGYTVDEKPENTVFSLPNKTAIFQYNINVMNGKVQVVSMISINKATYLQTEYPALREFYNLIVAKHAEQLVIKKKT